MTIADESESNENTRRPRLSAKDARALAFVLDPHGEKALVDASSVSCGTNVVISGTDNAPQEALAPIAQHLRASLAARERAIVERCKDAVASASSSAESRHVVIHEEAVVAFSQLIDECPEYASALVNRAQAYIALREYDKAMHDLTRAIGLLDRHGVESDPVGQVLLARVYSQRAMTRTLVEKRSTEAARTSTGTSDTDSTSMTISLAARQDLQRAAALGDQFARRELVRTNPYAMMCNAMMRGYLERTCNASGGGGDTGK